MRTANPESFQDWPFCYRGLSPTKFLQRLASITEPQQAEDSNYQNLAQDRKAVDQECHGATKNRCFCQIQDGHNFLFGSARANGFVALA